MSVPETLRDALADGWSDDDFYGSIECEAPQYEQAARVQKKEWKALGHLRVKGCAACRRCGGNLREASMVAGESPARRSGHAHETDASLGPCVEVASERLREMYRELGPLASGVHVSINRAATESTVPPTITNGGS